MANLKSKFIAFMRMTWQKKLLFISAFILLGYARIITRIIPFKYIAKYFLASQYLKSNKLTQENIFHKAIIIGAMVTIAAKYTLWKSKCLEQALVCKFILRYFNIPNTLIIGVQKSEDELLAHAWIKYEVYIINGGRNSPNEFKTISEFTDFSQQ